MKIRQLTLATCAALSSFLLVVTDTATADEFHGHWVKGRILETYNRLGGYTTFGNAITEELNAANGGKFQEFQHDSSIYWHPSVSNGVARQVGGQIRGKWGAYNWENGYLRYPVTDELPTRAANERFNHFQGGSVYWSPATGAHTVQGRIRDYWAKLGWEKSRFGFPSSEEYEVSGGAIQQEFQGQNLQWVPLNSSSLAPYTPGYSSYDQQYLLFDQTERWTPQSINREVVTHFNQYFTFTGCPNELHVGAKCGLDTVGGMKAPVKIEAISADGFSIRSLEGHPEGADRLIKFKFTTYNYNGATNIRLRVQASGPVSNASYLGLFNSETVARYSWSKFSQNLQNRINNSPTTYITSDKFTPSVRRFRAIPPEPTPAPLNDSGMEAEVIDPATVDTSKITNEVPLFPADTEDAKLEQSLGTTNSTITKETSEPVTETTIDDETGNDTAITEP